MSLHRAYEPARACTGGPSPGAKALMAFFLGRYGSRGGTNLGIYNCRPVRGSNATTSLHGEGRACDFGINPHGATYGTEIAELLRAKSAELGVQCVIWNRKIWSGSYPDAGWRAYSGTNPHVDHIHLELSKAAADGLTPERIHRVLSLPQKSPQSRAPQPTPQPRVRKDDCMYIKCQPGQDKPVMVAILSGPMFVGLGTPGELKSAEGEIARGATCQWVDLHTWLDLDRRSQALCANPRAVVSVNPNPPGGQS